MSKKSRNLIKRGWLKHDLFVISPNPDEYDVYFSDLTEEEANIKIADYTPKKEVSFRKGHEFICCLFNRKELWISSDQDPEIIDYNYKAYYDIIKDSAWAEKHLGGIQRI